MLLVLYLLAEAYSAGAYLDGYCAAWCLDREYQTGAAYKKGCRCTDDFEKTITELPTLHETNRRSTETATEPRIVDFNNYKSDHYTRLYSED